jgi:hypothetical protein
VRGFHPAKPALAALNPNPQNTGYRLSVPARPEPVKGQ